MDGHDYLANVMKELSHPTRLQILEVLALEGESCVCHLEQRLELRQAYISQQLARLRNAGLVVDRRDGLNVFYALAHPAIGPLLFAVRDTASTLAETQDRPITYRDVLANQSEPCSCPKCRRARMG
jgi:DNA-binding transcriptional ArsR family regulator